MKEEYWKINMSDAENQPQTLYMDGDIAILDSINQLPIDHVLFKRFLELLTAQEVKPRSVTWYADKLCITPKYLSTVCKIVSDKTAFEWINEYVMTDVRHQLKYSTRSIKEVSDYLGFPNISFFGKYVKQHSGLNPSDYKKQLRQEEEKA